MLSRRELACAATGCLMASSHPSGANSNQQSAFGLGTVTYNVPKDWDFDTLLKIAKEANLEAIEFRTTHAHKVEPLLGEPERREIRAKLAASGIKQFSLGTTCEFQSPDRSVVEQNVATCIDFIKLAKDIGALGIKVRPNGLPKEVPLEKTLEQIGKAAAKCGAAAADHGVEIWIEVHGGGTQIPANMRTIMQHCGHPSVGVTWNSNGTDVADGSVKGNFELLRPYIKCVHINDLWGSYPYRELFGLLKATQYNRYCLCEVGTPVKPEDGALFFKCYRGLFKELCR